MSAYHNILLATDLTNESYNVARKAIQLSQLFNAKLHIVHVIEPIPSYALGYIIHDEVQNSRHQEALALIDKLKKELVFEADSLQVKHGTSSHTIIDVAKSLSVDLIVIGSHGASGIERILIGSTTSAVIQKAQCDVLTVRYKN